MQSMKKIEESTRKIREDVPLQGSRVSISKLKTSRIKGKKKKKKIV